MEANCSSSRDDTDSFTPCSVCDKILQGVQDTNKKRSPSLPLGTVDEAEASGCSWHLGLIKQMRLEIANIDPRRRRESGSPGNMQLVVMPAAGNNSATLQLFSEGQNIGAWDLLLVNKPEIPDHRGTGHVLDPEWINMEQLGSWNANCHSNHGRRCDNPLHVESVRPALLIDTSNMCLVPGSSCESYVCLSYRWGSTEVLRVTSDNLHLLKQKDALSGPIFANSISPIIKNAMHVVRAIEERYLWVDALCIVQDDPVTTAGQLSIMGLIYASAVVTIVAVDGDSQTGLCGLKGVSSPRHRKQHSIPFCNQETLILEKVDTRAHLAYQRGYFSRGWTFQEYYMASRRLVMGGYHVSWECACSIFHEVGVRDIMGDLATIKPFTAIPNKNRLERLLQGFSNRYLSYDEDAFPAIAGLLTVVSSHLPGGFIYGIPEMFLDMALSWHPGGGGLKRRKASGRPPFLEIPSDLPSWSWIGWQGRFEWPDEDGLGSFASIQKFQSETIPITEWYASREPTGATRRCISQWWFAERERLKDRSQPLPDGWKRLESDFQPPVHTGEKDWEYNWPKKPEEFWKWCFVHESEPDTKFWYPVPTADAGSSPILDLGLQTRYLMCETHRTRLYAYQYSHPAQVGAIVRLLDKLGNPIGRLFPNNDQDAALFPEDREAGLAIELVAICRLRRPAPWESWDDPPSVKGEKKGYYFSDSEVYKVLWVEWEDGVAYRRAIGAVEKAFWEAQELEPISLVLG